MKMSLAVVIVIGVKFHNWQQCYKCITSDQRALLRELQNYVMAKVTVINRKTRIASDSHGRKVELQQSIRTHCRGQLRLLCDDFFDAVDDFLFAGGSHGQFTEESNYLKAMRELRTKRKLFEEAFIDITITMLFAGKFQRDDQELEPARHLVDQHTETYEILEIDLALQAMQRKADRLYGELHQQLEAIFTRVQFESGADFPCKMKLIDASLWAFGEAQRVFALPLELRLVVIKLFEQHFLLKLDSLYREVIGIAKQTLTGNANSPRRIADADPDSQQTRICQSESVSEQEASSAGTIDSAVDAVVTGYQGIPNLPAFVADMIRCKWRTVLFLIGVNRGCESAAWRQAIGAMQQLVSCTTGQSSIANEDLKQLLMQLCKGFALLQMPKQEQENFVNRVHGCLHDLSNKSMDKTVIGVLPTRETPASEASLSPSGKKVLDREDLDEIASLLGDDSVDASKTAIEKQLMDCLPEIDRLPSDTTVQYRLNGNFQSCSLIKSPNKPGMYTITDKHSKTTVTRSRLGLAISLHEGELKLPGLQLKAQSSQKTLIEKGRPAKRLY